MLRNIANKYFIHEKLKEVPYVYSKAKTLAYVHMFFILLGLVMFTTTVLFTHDESVPILWGCLAVCFLSILFKKQGNLVVSGNLLAGLYFCVLLSAVSSTGGIYSDNLLWILIAPLVALLFANRISGIIWTVVLTLVTFYFYFQDIDNRLFGNFYELLFDPEYYLVSYTAFFGAVVYIVHIFEKGKEEIIDLVIGNNKELERRKLQLKEQRNLLRDQKKQLESMGQELKASNSDLQNFAQAAAHDIKQPLRMMGTYLQLMQRDKDSVLSEKSLEYMNYVIQNAENLQQLLKGLLDLSKVEKEALNHSDVSLNDVLIIVQNNLTQRIKETNAVVHCENLPDIYGPKSLIIQLFQNLIANGIKFQRKGTLPVITISAEKKIDEVIIQVKDNGIGIELEYQEKIFKIFERLHTQTQYEGSGIGLHTCKKIVQSMGKDIWLESVPGHGTTFFFTLPLLAGTDKQVDGAIKQKSYQSLR